MRMLADSSVGLPHQQAVRGNRAPNSALTGNPCGNPFTPGPRKWCAGQCFRLWEKESWACLGVSFKSVGKNVLGETQACGEEAVT